MALGAASSTKGSMTPDQKHKAIRLNAAQLSQLKRELYFNRAHGRCEACRNPVQLGRCHLAHKKSRGAGGDDSKENCMIKCIRCHLTIEHGPQWSKRESH